MKININNIEKLAEAIRTAEGKAKVRTISAEKIVDIINEIGKDIPKKRLSGTTVLYDGAEHFPNAYRYRPESTHFEAENVNGRWYITNIYRGACPNRYKYNTIVSYSDEAKEYILEQASNVLM